MQGPASSSHLKQYSAAQMRGMRKEVLAAGNHTDSTVWDTGEAGDII